MSDWQPRWGDKALYDRMDDLMAVRGRVYQVYAPGGGFVNVTGDLEGALAVVPQRGIVLEVDRGGASRAFDHTGRQLSI